MTNEQTNKTAGRPIKRTSAAESAQAKRASAAESTQIKKRPYSSFSSRARKVIQQSPLRIAFLGGLNEIGKNITLYEYQDDMFLVDCGMAFPDNDMPGVDIVIPDFTYIERNKDKIRGIVLTHGHEDHIGSLPYLLKKVNVPVYGTRLTLGLVEGKLKEHGLLNQVKLNVVKPGQTVRLGSFRVEFIHVNHSIPDAVAFAIKSPAGVIIQTGDFKIDSTPIDGDIIDLARFGEYGSKGVLALLSDSTNAEIPGFTESESKVGDSFENLFRKAGNHRIIVATFASNIHRVQQIVDVAQRLGRKVVLSGRSLENVMSIGIELGYLNVPQGLLINIDQIRNYPPEQLVIITTGSQGEPMSALHRMAYSDHRKISILPGDYVIISATPIPGNEKTVSNVVNELMKLGAQVIYERMYDVHVSGHACNEEQKIMMGLVKPKFFIPVHGEQKHLRKHANLACAMGIKEENIVIADNGNVLELTRDEIKVASTVPSGAVLVDGYGVGDVGSIVLRDRKHLAEDGLIIVVATIQSGSGEILAGPDVVSRGFVYVREAEQLIEDARCLARDILIQCSDNNIHEWGTIKTKIRDEVSKMMYERTKRNPMILPVIMEV